MSSQTRPACTGCASDRADELEVRYVDLPCGCQDVHYAGGTVCFEHAHVDCDGTPEEPR